MYSHLELGTSAAACAITVILSIPHGYSLITQGKRGKQYTIVEPNCDEATATGKHPRSLWQRVCLVVVGVVAAAAALWSWISSTRSAIAQVLLCISWAFILFQGIALASSRHPTERYSLGIYSALAAIPTGVSISLPYALALHRGEHPLLSSSHHALNAVQLVAALILLVVNLSLPRGPPRYRDGHVIDRRDSVSFLNRYTFSWAYRTLSLAAKNGRLNPEDLALVAEEVRAQTLSDSFFSTDPTSVQWRKWLKLYWRSVAVQVTVQLCNSVVGFLPNLLLLTILRLFEARDAGASNQLQLWLAALALGMSMVATAWLVALRDFIADLKISLPVNQQLFAVISKKALNLRDTAVPERGSPGSDDENEDEEDEEDDNGDDRPPHTKHSILNLLGVDVERISDFIAYSHLLLDSVVEFILTTAFLVYLMGWKATLAGCTIPLLLTPLYYSITKQYSEREQALMDRRDEKSASLTEMIQGIRQIKFSALEAEWYEKIQKLRTKELNEQRAVFWLNIVLNGMYTLVPIFMSCFSIAAYVYLNGSISPSTAFTALSLFETLQNTICILPEVITQFLDARVSLGRIAKFLGLEEHVDRRSPGNGNGISLDNATIAWPSSGMEAEDQVQFQLKDLDLEFPLHELSIISGRSGSGKSMLLQALIGEADIVKGAVTIARPEPDPGPATPQNWIVQGMIAYVSQDPWIENATIRDSILFGLPFNPARYEDVLYSCALLPDLKAFPDGDRTDVGANGINLSGGQKWRLALARALYSRASILILDDIFSAVDAHVGRHLYEHALTGPLAEERTRILATHHVKTCIDGAAYLVRLDNGHVHARQLGTSREATLETTDSSGPSTRPSSPNPRMEATRPQSNSVVESKKFYEEEKRETGVIKAGVYKAYIRASGGYIPWLLTAVFLVILLLLNLAIPYWVSIWTRSYETEADGRDALFAQPGDRAAAGGGTLAPRSHLDKRLVFYGSIYLAISFGSWILEIIRISVILYGSLKASKTMFEQFTMSILRAPLRFLDTTPAGQILNRFTSDFSTLDSDLAIDLAYTLHDAITVLGVVVAAMVTSPIVVGLGILSLGASWTVGYFYVTAAREAKRLQSTAKSPIFELVGSLLTGLPTVRAFGREQAYLTRLYDLIDTYCQALWHRKLFASWRAIWLSLVGAVFVAAVTMILVSVRSLDAPLAGFVLSFALDMSSNVTWLLSQYASLEINSNAAERIVEYTQLEQEPQSGADVPATWPSKGQVEISSLTVAYAPDLPPVLRNLNFCIRAGERVGIVGRTGAGKSSFAMTLLRCLDVREGSIRIDGFDIEHVKLRDLRERVGLISQDPIMFAGTIREILDPFKQHDDTELHAALEKVGLSSPTPAQHPASEDRDAPSSNAAVSPALTVLQLSLSTPIAAGGKNLSQGQRQLLCLARALVSRPKILIMDEATASIDVESDQRIQRVLREDICGAGCGCTLIVIAHRLSTIADFDRVVVLERGEVVEMDSPRLLMAVEDGVFRGMVEGSGERKVVNGLILGEGRGW